jgi:gamma-glutamylcyclotransferase
MSNLLYFTYGSNLHPLRLTSRIHKAKFIGVCKLAGYKIVFNKIGKDNSSKCSLLPSSTYEVYGVVYKISENDSLILNKFEGKGYNRKNIEVSINDNITEVYTYIAHPNYIDKNLKPFTWYKNLVVLGGNFHKFPKSYINRIDSYSSVKDSDSNRQDKYDALILKINSIIKSDLGQL